MVWGIIQKAQEVINVSEQGIAIASQKGVHPAGRTGEDGKLAMRNSFGGH